MRRLLSPKWLLGHVLVLTVLVAFPNLGLWQLDRHAEREERNALLTERPEQPPVSAAELTGGGEGLTYRRVTLSGQWEADDEVLLSTRPLGGQPGHHVLTPLRLDGGGRVLVDRGWVPYETAGPPVPDASPPDGTVEVRGLVLPPETARRVGSRDGEDGGAVDFVTAADPAAVGAALDEPLLDLVVLAEEGHRADGAELPATVPPPQPESGSHYSYAVQWFVFAAVVAVGYPVLLWRTRQGAHEAR